MYDAVTRRLIEQAPPLEGIDSEELPKNLANAFAEIVRIRLGLVNEEGKAEEAQRRLERLRRLAATYQSFTILLPERENATSAAFVAATAHRLLHSAESDYQTTWLSIHGFSPDIAATLLFLIAGYFSDAEEIADKLEVEEGTPGERLILKSLQALGRSKFQTAIQIDLPAEESLSGVEEYLWLELSEGVRGLSALLLGEEPSRWGLPGEFEPEKWFDRIAELTTYTYSDSAKETLGDVEYAMAGPHQLALLLKEVSDSLLAHSIRNIPSPDVGSGSAWDDYLSRITEERPVLWRNQLQAVQDGALEPQTSSIVTFPTSAGKSTVAELKIASALVRDELVIYLAPTHALVNQVTSNIRTAFPDKTVRNSAVSEGFYVEVESTELPDVLVATPERCLTLLSVWPSPFQEIGLVVFDECHLMHPRDVTDRRALDAALCLLNLFNLTDSLEVLLMSAMVDNAAELSEWIEDVTDSPCHVFDDPWKPTRQAKGCVVYLREQIEELQATLRQAYQTADTKGPPKAVKDQLSVDPFALLSLRYQWSREANDFRRLGLLDKEVPLTANRNWRLTANRNEVAAQLGARFASNDLNTLVFAQQVNWAKSTAGTAGGLLKSDGAADLELNGEEKQWLQTAVEELGGEEHVLVPFEGCAAIHHGLQLDAERKLNESVFSREDGVNLLVATSTLAQGMNLPADVVIIGGDDRFEEDSKSLQSLEAHELLNAAGRAGRAGFSSHGLVLVVPGAVVGFEPSEGKLSDRWFDLQKRIFSKSDQCLSLGDPIELLLDKIESGDAPDLAKYFVCRLPVIDAEEETDFLNASLAAFHAKTAGDRQEFEQRINSLRDAKERTLEDLDEVNTIATALGVAPFHIQNLKEETSNLSKEADTVSDLVRTFEGWLTRYPDVIDELFDRRQLERVCGERADGPSAQEQIRVLIDATLMWMNGGSLREIELFLGTAEDKLKNCRQARKLTQRLLRGVTYGIGWIVLIERVRRGPETAMPLHFGTAAACVREGFNRPEKLGVSMRLRARGRVACHRFFEENQHEFPDRDEISQLDEVYEIVDQISD